MKKFVNFTLNDITEKTINPFEPTYVDQQTKLNKKRFGKNIVFNSKKRGLVFSLKKKISLKKETSVLCTISGGQDSILNFFLLLHTTARFQVIYCHHLWQIKNFFSARLIFHLTYLVNVPYTLILPQNLVITENESREWRKKNFFRVSYMNYILTSLTGHTETDTLEKNLNNLIRGTSPAGLESSKFLNSQNRVGLFFSARNFTPFLVIKFAKTRKLSRKKFSKNIKNQKNISPKKSVFLQNLSNFVWVEYTILGNKSVLMQPGQKLVIRKKSQKLRTQARLFKFFYSTKILTNKQRTHIAKLRNSCSFCFFSKFIKTRIKLLRPLKNISRFSVSQLVKLYQLPLLIDVTNFSSLFSRNKIRHQLIPFIRSLINPNVECLLIHFFKLIRQQNQDIEKEFHELYFIYKLLNLNSPNSYLIKLKKNSRDLQVNLFSKKELVKTVSEFQSRYFLQQLFFEYKNLNLNYYQSFKLQTF